MKRFACTCGQQVFFENISCVSCGSALGFDPGALSMVSLKPSDDAFEVVPGTSRVRYCANHHQGGCNWLVDANSPDTLCVACAPNRTIPDLSVAGNDVKWAAFEAAKRRLVYALLSFGLPIRTRAQDPLHGLAFDCVDDTVDAAGDARRAMTGHDNGIITVALAETDPARREAQRVLLGETYRTLLGHLRHEIGHYYWDVLVRDDEAALARFRELFGDEQIDYGEALKQHYADGPKVDWQNAFVTFYAASHPWEDFAETWAHLMHIVDTLETAAAFRVAVDTDLEAGRVLAPFEPYRTADFASVMRAWTPLTIAINCLNRSMGQPDLYPFVLPAPAVDKLAFVRDLIVARGRG